MSTVDRITSASTHRFSGKMQVWSWGSGKYGCLGLGDDDNRWRPSRILLFAEGQPHTVETISAGKWHALCLTQKQKVYAWGRNNWGQASLCWRT